MTTDPKVESAAVEVCKSTISEVRAPLIFSSLELQYLL